MFETFFPFNLKFLLINFFAVRLVFSSTLTKKKKKNYTVWLSYSRVETYTCENRNRNKKGLNKVKNNVKNCQHDLWDLHNQIEKLKKSSKHSVLNLIKYYRKEWIQFNIINR